MTAVLYRPPPSIPSVSSPGQAAPRLPVGSIPASNNIVPFGRSLPTSLPRSLPGSNPTNTQPGAKPLPAGTYQPYIPLYSGDKAPANFPKEGIYIPPAAPKPRAPLYTPGNPYDYPPGYEPIPHQIGDTARSIGEAIKKLLPREASRPELIKYENPRQNTTPQATDIPTNGGTIPNREYNLKVTVTRQYDYGGITYTENPTFDLGNAFGAISKAFSVSLGNSFLLQVLVNITPDQPKGVVRGLGSYETTPSQPGAYYYSNPRLNVLFQGQVEAPEAPTLPSSVPDTIPQFLPPGLPDPVYPGEEPPVIPDYPPSLPRPELPEDDPPEKEPEPPAPEPPVTEPPPPEPKPEKPRETPAPIPAPAPTPEPPESEPSQPDPIPGTPQQDVPEGTPFRSPFAPAEIPPAQPLRSNPDTQNPTTPLPGVAPAIAPAQVPTQFPAQTPATQPGTQPTTQPTTQPQPATSPGTTPNQTPATEPGTQPTTQPGTTPTQLPTQTPSIAPAQVPTQTPTHTPGTQPETQPGTTPAQVPSSQPGTQPGNAPAQTPTPAPAPSFAPTTAPYPSPAENVTTTPTTTTPSTAPAPNPTPGNTPAPINPFPQPPAPLPPVTCPPGCKPDEPMDICNAPCIKDLQQKVGAIDDKLDLLEKLQELLEALQGGGTEPGTEPPLKFVPLSVPIITCNLDGTVTTTPTDIQVLDGSQSSTLQQFQALAAMQTLQCQTQRHSERSHNILGGNLWFKDDESRAAKLRSRVEADISSFRTIFEAAENKDPNTPAPGVDPSDVDALKVGEYEALDITDLMSAYIATVYYRGGFHGYPTEVPQTLLGYTDADPPETIRDLSSYLDWFIRQFDALVGNFPIKIRVEDIDPLTPGNQVKEIELPNISEALAEMYGMNIGTSVNADVSVNFLMRLASEMIATKNSSLITQDYVRANAAFLGYKGNPARREINYSFDPAKLGSLDEFLKESKGYVVGWEEDDKESVVGFLQRIVFSAGIIKAAFFRDNKRLAELQKEIESMMSGDKVATDAEWNAILALINSPTEYFNKDSIPKPRVREKPVPPPPEPTA